MPIWTTEYDVKLNALDIYIRYPELKPFVGNNYSKQKTKILFIGESHYVPKQLVYELYTENWYNGDSSCIPNSLKNYIYTRRVIEQASDRSKYNKSFTIFYNIEDAIYQSKVYGNVQKPIFQYCGFMNYFLRPSRNKVSIDRNEIDKELSFQNIIALKSILNFDMIIFTSKMAYIDFELYYSTKDHGVQVLFDVVPHPSRSWWNRKSNAYKDSDGNKLTGKEKLLDILCNL